MGEPVIHTAKVTVRYQETDQMGVAHHSVYPVWFEAGRTEFIRSFGMPYGKMEADGMYLPLIALACEYKGFARYEDELEIRSRISDITKTRLSFKYDVVKNGTVIASGSTAHVYANRELRPVNLSKYMPGLYALFMRIAGREDGEPAGAAAQPGMETAK